MKRKFRLLFCFVAVTLFASLLLVSTGVAVNAITTITRVSVSNTGAGGNSSSYDPAISGDGRYVAFSSYANNLVPGDYNSQQDVFLRDTILGVTTLISVDSSGNQANGPSYVASVSMDGRFVAFSSEAGNLVSGDTNGWEDIFVRDTQAGTTTRVSVSSTGAQGNDAAYYPSISADGRYVSFTSCARNIVPEDDNNACDVFLHDRQSGSTSLVSVDSSGSLANADSYSSDLSDYGRYVAFFSAADNLISSDPNGYHVDVFVHDTVTGNTSAVSVDSSGVLGNNESYYPSISGDGRYVSFTSDADNLVAGDTNMNPDVFVHDRQSGVTTRVSVKSDGQQANSASYTEIPSAISGDGRFVTFYSYANNLIIGDTRSVSASQADTGWTGRTMEGKPQRWLANGSGSAYGDIFIHDMLTGTTARLSLDSHGSEANGNSYGPVISADGLYVAFYSYASNLVAGDGSSMPDIFIVPATVYSLSVSKTGDGLVYTSSSTESGISCGTVCTNTFVSGTSITLKAVPNGTGTFFNWDGSVNSTQNPITFIINGDMSIHALFSEPLKIYLPYVIQNYSSNVFSSPAQAHP